MVWRSRKDENEKVMASFSSSSFGVITTAATTNAALVDDVKAPAKDGSKEEATDETARTSGYLLYPIVVRGSGYYFIMVCRSLDTLAIVEYVESGTDSSKILQRS